MVCCLAAHWSFLLCSPGLKSQLMRQLGRNTRGRALIRTQDGRVTCVSVTTGAMQPPTSLLRDNGNVATYLKIQHSLKATSFFSLTKTFGASSHLRSNKTFFKITKKRNKTGKRTFLFRSKNRIFLKFQTKAFLNWNMSVVHRKEWFHISKHLLGPGGQELDREMLPELGPVSKVTCHGHYSWSFCQSWKQE